MALECWGGRWLPTACRLGIAGAGPTPLLQKRVLCRSLVVALFRSGAALPAVRLALAEGIGGPPLSGGFPSGPSAPRLPTLWRHGHRLGLVIFRTGYLEPGADPAMGAALDVRYRRPTPGLVVCCRRWSVWLAVSSLVGVAPPARARVPGAPGLNGGRRRRRRPRRGRGVTSHIRRPRRPPATAVQLGLGPSWHARPQGIMGRLRNGRTRNRPAMLTRCLAAGVGEVSRQGVGSASVASSWVNRWRAARRVRFGGGLRRWRPSTRGQFSAQPASSAADAVLPARYDLGERRGRRGDSRGPGRVARWANQAQSVGQAFAGDPRTRPSRRRIGFQALLAEGSGEHRSHGRGSYGRTYGLPQPAMSGQSWRRNMKAVSGLLEPVHDAQQARPL